MRGSAEVVAVARDVAASSPSKPAPASDMTRYANPPILLPAAAAAAAAAAAGIRSAFLVLPCGVLS